MPVAPVKWQFDAIGTSWEIELYTPPSPSRVLQLQAAIEHRIAEFDQVYSRFRPDSLVAGMSKAAGRYELPPDSQSLLDLYKLLYGLTGGAVTPLIGQLLSDAGYDANYSLIPGALTAPPAWDEVLIYNYPYLTVKAPALLDFGAAGKGYLVDIVAAMLRSAGCASYCVDGGGDMAYLQASQQPLDVALEHPADPAQAVGVAHLSPGTSICGSAGNRRAWGKFHHIIDPRSQASPRHLAAVWVVADTTLLADALTTALYFVPAKVLAAPFRFEYAIIHADHSLEHSIMFPADFFS